jgi:hypothetical protein
MKQREKIVCKKSPSMVYPYHFEINFFKQTSTAFFKTHKKLEDIAEHWKHF